jgi:ribonuclease Z
MEFELVSRAMTSTWIHLPENNTLLDAGDAVATTLGRRAGRIRHVFLSHDHFDHIGGLPALIHYRASDPTARNNPLEIHFPKHSGALDQILALGKAMGRANIQYSQIHPQETVQVGKNRFVKAFAVTHGRYPKGAALGFALIEKRTKLKARFQGLPQTELRAAASQGETLSLEVNHILLAYSGDAMPIPVEECAHCGILLHDTNFLEESHREQNTHASLAEVVRLATQAKPKTTIAIHVSPRYSKEQREEATRQTGIPIARPGRLETKKSLEKGLPQPIK